MIFWCPSRFISRRSISSLRCWITLPQISGDRGFRFRDSSPSSSKPKKWTFHWKWQHPVFQKISIVYFFNWTFFVFKVSNMLWTFLQSPNWSGLWLKNLLIKEILPPWTSLSVWLTSLAWGRMSLMLGRSRFQVDSSLSSLLPSLSRFSPKQVRSRSNDFMLWYEVEAKYY